MLVLSFALEGRGNCAIVADLPYVYARTAGGSFVLPARCPHRGGPLHLATVEPGDSRLFCPWHDRPASVTRLLRHGIPAVRRGDVVTAVFATDPGTSHELVHLPMSTAVVAGRPVGGRNPG